MTIFSVTVPGVISTYTDLRDAITAETDGRANSASLDRFIKQAETEIRMFLRKNPVRPMRTRVSTVVNAEFINAPLDMVKPISMEITTLEGQKYRLPSIDSENLSKMQGKYLFDNRPYAFTREGDELRFYPVPLYSYPALLFYFQDLPPISTDASSNWLLEEFPQIYLAGTLYYAYRDMPDIEKAGLMKGIFEEQLSRLADAYPEASNEVTLSVDPDMLQRRWLWQIV